MSLQNLPIDVPTDLAELITCRPGHISSMSLVRDAPIDFMLLAAGKNESISEEEYFGDTLYYVVEGAIDVVLPERRETVSAGQVFEVPAHELHAIEGSQGQAFKILQLTIPE